MTQNTDQERKLFEAFASDDGKWLKAIERDARGDYLLLTTAVGWMWWQAARSAPAAPEPQGWKLVPVGWQFYEDGKWWNGDDRIKDHRKNTEEARYPIRDVYAVEQHPNHQSLHNTTTRSVKNDFTKSNGSHHPRGNQTLPMDER